MAVRPGLYLGLMSGTSLDGIDACLVHIDGDEGSNVQWVDAHAHALSEPLRAELLALCSPGDNEIERLGRADRWLGEAFALASCELLAKTRVPASTIIALGSHGQTIRHSPPGPRPTPAYTLQIGDPNTIAQLTGIKTVADFRRRDIAEGGQGAPLVPVFHQCVFGADHERRVIVNIGGMANITLLNAGCDTTGFDTGPGNVLMDHWAATNLKKPYDHNGAWAARGVVAEALLEALLAHPYFRQPVPKSTGRETFNLDWLHAHLTGWPQLSAADIQATLLEFTARTIADAIRTHAPPDCAVYVCGGGALNGALMNRLSSLLTPCRVATTEVLGIAPKWVEAAAFAWLAARTMAGLPGSLPGVTGARRPAILGGIYQA